MFFQMLILEAARSFRQSCGEKPFGMNSWNYGTRSWAAKLERNPFNRLTSHYSITRGLHCRLNPVQATTFGEIRGFTFPLIISEMFFFIGRKII